jgi:predicted metal-binding membrane protein
MADAMKATAGESGSSTYMWLMPIGRWGTTEFVLGFAMWAIMMVGMMVPSASPMLFAFHRISFPVPTAHPRSFSWGFSFWDISWCGVRSVCSPQQRSGSSMLPRF